MDLSKPVYYRGLNINSAVLETGRTLRGITVESIDYSNINTVGYTEKRAGSDGMHASDIYLGDRRVELTGHIYAPTLPGMFDLLHVVRAVFSPTSAYIESPGDRGFLPMSFEQPTLDTTSYPSGIIPLFMNLRPDPPRFSINRDRQDGSGGKRPVSTPWAVRLTAKDPRMYVNPAQSVSIVSPASAIPGVAMNRGDYETPLNIQLVVGATVPGAGSYFRITGLNGIDMKIVIEAKANTIYRWFGDDRVLMTQDVSGGTNTAPLIMRMDLVTFATLNRKPMVPAQINPPSKPFTTPFTYWCTTTLAPSSRLFWNEAFA